MFALAKGHVYQFRSEPFVLASGRRSQHYFDCKKITMVPERLELLTRVLRDEFIPQSGLPLPQAAGGLTLGADPIAYALSLAYWEQGHRVYPVIVRKASKDHGTAKLLEAEFDSQMVPEVLVLDDTVTTGSSSLQAVQALRSAGFQVKDCVAIVDREEGAGEALQKEGVRLMSLFKARDFLP